MGPAAAADGAVNPACVASAKAAAVKQRMVGREDRGDKFMMHLFSFDDLLWRAKLRIGARASYLE
jgi:hypothetical protein